MKPRTEDYFLWSVSVDVIVPKKYFMSFCWNEFNFPFRICRYITYISVITFITLINEEYCKNKP